MDLRNLYLVCNCERDLRPCSFTDDPERVWGDPSYTVEPVSPAEVSKLCKEHPHLRIFRHG